MGKPEKVFRCGGCEAAVFENQVVRQDGRRISMKRVSFQKRYLGADGEWKSTSSLDANDIPKAILALSKSYEYLMLRSAQGEEAGGEED
jgi:hypothetical protein